MKDEVKNTITLSNVRLSYPCLFKAKGFTGQDGTTSDPKFSATFILDKKQHAGVITEIQEMIEKASFLKFGKKGVILKGTALRDGSEKEDKDGYGDDVMFLSASSKTRPQVVHRDASIPLVEEDGIVYAGCYVNAHVGFWVQSNTWGKRVNANLLAVQFLRDGDPFGEKVNAEEVFSNVGEDPLA